MRAPLACLLLAALCAVICSADQPRWRDVLAGAFTYPFMTDAEIEISFDDTRGRVSSEGGPTLFRYPGISGVRVEGRDMSAQLVGPDLLRVNLPAGAHEVAVVTGGPPPPTRALPPVEGAVSTPEAFREAAAHLQPGDELVVADGVHTDWRVEVSAEGTAQAPILIRAETPGGVTFRRNSSIRLSGRHLILKGFRFDNAGPWSVVQFVEAEECRMTQCGFFHCGNPTNMFAHIVNVSMGSHRNRVDHCYFTGSRSMSIGQSIRAVEGVGMHNRYAHNVFRDIYRYWVNGQEPIQLGQNQAVYGAARPEALVEVNLFDHAWGDSEIVSSKSSGNVIRHNVAAHCIRSDFTLRGGDGTLFEGNVMVNNQVGVRPMGNRHVIINNLFVDMRGAAVAFSAGTADGANVVATDEALVAHNTFINCGGPAVTASATTEERPFAPTGNRFINNIFLGVAPLLLDTTNLPDAIVQRNLFWTGGPQVEGATGEEAVLANPRLEGAGPDIQPAADSPALGAAMPLPEVRRDRRNRARPGGDAPDIGADERDGAAPAEPLLLPAIPPRPLLAPELYTGEQVWAQSAEEPLLGLRREGDMEAVGDAAQLSDAEAAVDLHLPADFVLVWEYQPEAFSAQASLAFCADGDSGYVLSWGGLTEEGLPAGLVELRKTGAEEVIADAADLVYYHQDFRHHGWGPGTRYTSDAPQAGRWYRFVVLKEGGRLIVLLHGTIATQYVPVLVWEDDGIATGPSPAGDGLRIRQEGTGRWRGLRAWRYDYRGDVPPPPPALTATPHGGGRIALEWRETAALQAASRFDVYRGTEAGFGLTPDNLLAAGLTTPGFDDFSVRPNTRYWYAVRAYNPLDLASQPAYIEATAGTGPPAYHVIPASDAQVSPPITVGTDPESGREGIWAPGAPREMEAAPEKGGADFTVVIDEPGQYAVWGLVLSPDEATDSFHIALNPNRIEDYRQWHTGIHHWGWSRAVGAARLGRGEHVISIKHREPNTRLAALLVTSDPAFTPAGARP